MEGKKLIETIRLENILSYGPGNEPLPLEPLNVFIGPNASGKSNLIEALSLLRAAPWDLQASIMSGGGVSNWLWKGAPENPIATVEVTLPGAAVRYRLSFTENWSNFQMVDEVIEEYIPTETSNRQPDVYYRYRQGRPELAVYGQPVPQYLKAEEFIPNQSILSQRRDPQSYPMLWSVGTVFRSVELYRDWYVGRSSVPRFPQRPDSYQGALLQDSSNLALVLNELLAQPQAKERLLEQMKDLYPSFNDMRVYIGNGMVQIFFHEKGLFHLIPASRLSDGTLRYLSLLTVLCHPNPPWVVCIEEPELGLHPDVIPEVAKMLVEASTRSQIFVTTHSDILVDALTDVPESVVICEKPEGSTQLRRLNADELKLWLEEYRLGDLWTSGQIGGNRW